MHLQVHEAELVPKNIRQIPKLTSHTVYRMTATTVIALAIWYKRELWNFRLQTASKQKLYIGSFFVVDGLIDLPDQVTMSAFKNEWIK